MGRFLCKSQQQSFAQTFPLTFTSSSKCREIFSQLSIAISNSFQVGVRKLFDVSRKFSSNCFNFASSSMCDLANVKVCFFTAIELCIVYLLDRLIQKPERDES